MKKSQLTVAVKKMASDVGLRRISATRPGDNWVGIHRGIVVLMNLDSVRLHLELTSPEEDPEPDGADPESDGADPESDGADPESDGADPESDGADPESDGADPESDGATEVQDDASRAASDESEVESNAFRRTTALGLPGDWFEQNSGDPWGFQLVIDQQRRRQLAPAALEGILDAVVQDLHDLGAETTQACCQCVAEATTLGYFDTPHGPVVTPYCEPCWEAARLDTRGVIRTNRPKNLLPGLCFLIAATLVFAAVWGFAQHPRLGLPLPFLLLGCIGAGIAIAMLTSRFAGGSSLGLRLAIATCVVAATLVGNIIGVKLLLDAKEIVVSWFELIPAYFVDYFPAHAGQEIMFLSGGMIGVLIGFYLLRASERIHLR